VTKRDNVRLRAAVAIVGVALLSACGPRADKLPKNSSAKPIEAPASIAARVQVLNGDVLVIDGKHVRLAEYVAPQGIPDARCWAEALAAKQANETLRAMVLSGHSISMTPTGGEDAFGRTYAKVTLNGIDLGQTLYHDGLVAKGTAFGWCQPVSRAAPGAPEVNAVMDGGFKAR
jgi:hypothetical protein